LIKVFKVLVMNQPKKTGEGRLALAERV